jgi:hypothetical protein
MSNKATPDQIKSWKEEHGDVFQISIEDGKKVCYLRKPNRKELSYAGKAGETDPWKFNEIILKSCWLGGDEDIQTDDSLFMAASMQIAVVTEFKKSEIAKL